MSWGFHKAGDKDAVAKAVLAETAYGDPAQLDDAKAFIAHEVFQFPCESGEGVSVEARGHHDSHSRDLFIEIKKVTLAKDPA